MNQYGKTSKLHLHFSGANTVLSHAEFTAPFKVMKPFPMDTGLSVMVMSSSAGLFSGDVQEISLCLEEHSRAKVFSQSYEKIHPSPQGHSRRNTQITVGSGCQLQYRPLPTIPFADSRFQGETTVLLEDDTAQLILSETFSCGRVAMGEEFLFASYGARTTVSCQGKYLYRDNLLYEPQKRDLTGFAHQEGYSHQSSLLFFHFPIDKVLEQEIQEKILAFPQVLAGYSQSYTGDLVLRILGNSGQEILAFQEEITSVVLCHCAP